jgi:hypothetical protein
VGGDAQPPDQALYAHGRDGDKPLRALGGRAPQRCAHEQRGGRARELCQRRRGRLIEIHGSESRQFPDARVVRGRQAVEQLREQVPEQVRSRCRQQPRAAGDAPLLVLDRDIDGVGAVELIAFRSVAGLQLPAQLFYEHAMPVMAYSSQQPGRKSR